MAFRKVDAQYTKTFKLEDGEEFNFKKDTIGFARVMVGDVEEIGEFGWGVNEDVFMLSSSSTNFVKDDTPNSFCVFKNSENIVTLKNNLGGKKNVIIHFFEKKEISEL